MTLTPPARPTVGAAAALAVLTTLATSPLIAMAQPSTAFRAPAPGALPSTGPTELAAATSVSASALSVGIAAIAGAGLKALAVMDVPGPPPVIEPSVAEPTPAAPSVAPQRSPAARRAPSGAAWHSGASGQAAADGSFGTWRGEPLQVVGVWGDTSAQEQSQINMLDAYRDYDGDVDVAVGGLADGESWQGAARGDYVDRWTTAIRSVKGKRAGRSGTTYVRFAHEMNGDWYAWKVTPGNVGDFRAAWRIFHDLLAKEYPAAKLVFSPNSGNHSGVAQDEIWPGDGLVDVIGVDFYDGWPAFTDQAVWDQELYSTADGPKGLGAWQRYAEAHGKPLALPEWGLQTGDRPFFITAMHDFLSTHAATPGKDLAGRLLYDIYFNIPNSGKQGFVIYGGPNPRAAQTYRDLTWGRR